MIYCDPIMVDMPICNRCGQCCYLRLNGKKKRCKFLVYLGAGKYVCRTFKTRIGRFIGEIDGVKFHCDWRSNHQKNYKGCEFNKKEWGDEIDDRR